MKEITIEIDTEYIPAVSLLKLAGVVESGGQASYEVEQGHVTMDGTPETIFADAERLVALDLDVPQTCRLSLALRKQWPDFPMCVRADEAYEALLARLKGGKAHA